MHYRSLSLIFVLFALLMFRAEAHGQLYAGPATPPIKDGCYIVGVWTYECTIYAAGTRSEGRCGNLRYKGHKLVAPVGTIVRTPVGQFIFFPYRAPNVMKSVGSDGWMQTTCYDEPLFNSDGSVIIDKSGGVNGVKASSTSYIDVPALLKINNLN